jgi:hypothetical protein
LGNSSTYNATKLPFLMPKSKENRRFVGAFEGQAGQKYDKSCYKSESREQGTGSEGLKTREGRGGVERVAGVRGAGGVGERRGLRG